MSRLNETRSLPVALTEEEFKVRAAELAKAAQRIKWKEDEAKSVKKVLKEELEELQETHSKLVRIVDEKREDRDVECTWRPEYDRKVWVLYRNDTGERVATESMSQQDLQGRLKLVDHDPETGEVFNDEI